MPNSAEHMRKYNLNKIVLTEALDRCNKSHYDWITTVCFYSALHIVEAKFAKKNIDHKNHKDRENEMRESDLFNRKLTDKYKMLSTYSKIARYGPGSIDSTLVSCSLQYLKDIEDEILPEVVKV